MKKKKINNKKGFPSNKHLGCCVLNESNLDVFATVEQTFLIFGITLLLNEL